MKVSRDWQRSNTLLLAVWAMPGCDLKGTRILDLSCPALLTTDFEKLNAKGSGNSPSPSCTPRVVFTPRRRPVFALSYLP